MLNNGFVWAWITLAVIACVEILTNYQIEVAKIESCVEVKREGDIK